MRYLLLLLVLSFVATSTFFFVEAIRVRLSLCATLIADRSLMDSPIDPLK